LPRKPLFFRVIPLARLSLYFISSESGRALSESTITRASYSLATYGLSQDVAQLDDESEELEAWTTERARFEFSLAYLEAHEIGA
jgi:hypothetical protein